MNGRARVVEHAVSCLGAGPECCADAAPGYDLTKAEWCQVFWLHCVRAAGLTDRVWPSGPAWPTAWLPTTTDPQPGDMGYIHLPFQHGCVVESVTTSTITTIDGNSTGGVVCRRFRSRREFTAFYSIASLLGEQEADAARRMQRALIAAGHDPGPIDGRPGPRTTRALLAWGLAHPESIV